MRAKVVGVKSVNYTSKKTGQPVQGAYVQFVRDLGEDERKSAVGKAVGSLFISAASPLINVVQAFKLEELYDFVYDFDGRFSHLVDIKPVKA